MQDKRGTNDATPDVSETRRESLKSLRSLKSLEQEQHPQ